MTEDVAEREGVIKFNLQFERRQLPDTDITSLRAWRRILKRLALLGQTPGRYDGFGFGNISMRTRDGFIISGSQTGRLPDPGLDAYALVTDWDLANNAVVGNGMVAPSSESLTHAAVYELSADVRFVFHVHSPDIWRHAADLGIPVTAASIPYGTPAMAEAVTRLMKPPAGVFAMGGHEDGVVGYGTTADGTGQALVGLLAAAFK